MYILLCIIELYFFREPRKYKENFIKEVKSTTEREQTTWPATQRIIKQCILNKIRELCFSLLANCSNITQYISSPHLLITVHLLYHKYILHHGWYNIYIMVNSVFLCYGSPYGKSNAHVILKAIKQCISTIKTNSRSSLKYYPCKKSFISSVI